MQLWRLTVTALCAAFFGSAALAVEPCGEVVVDQVGLLSASDQTRIASAATALTERGAVPRIRVTEGIGSYASIEAAADLVCPSWGDARVVLWVTTVSRDVVISAGPSWNNKLPDSTLNRIIDADMMPALPSAAAFIQPINSMVAELSPPGVAPQTAPTIQVRPEANQWSFLTWALVVGGVLLVLLGFVALRLWGHYRARQAAQLAAAEAADHCFAILDSFNAFGERILALIDGDAKTLLHAKVVDALLLKHSSLGTDAEQAMARCNAHIDPRTSGKTREEYEELRRSFTASEAELSNISERFQTLEEMITHAIAQARQTPATFAGAKSELERIKARVQSVRDQGFIVTSVEDTLAKLQSQLDTAHERMLQREFTEATRMLTTIRSEAVAAAEVAEELPKVKALLETDINTLRTAQAAHATLMPVAFETFSRMEATYAEANYRSVLGNGTEAEVRMDEVDELLEQAAFAVSQQNWDEAEQRLSSVKMKLGEIGSLLDAIMSLAKRLEEAQEGTEAELAEARKSALEARSYLNQHDDDTADSHYQTLESVLAVCLKVDGLLLAKRPDYLKAYRLASKADDEADEVLRLAQGERKRAQALRDKAARVRREALQAVATTEHYISNHAADVGDGAERVLKRAQAQMRELSKATDVSRVIALSRVIDELADKALETAESDFSAAENRRAAAKQLARKARQASSTSVTRSWGTSPTRRSATVSRSWRANAAPSTKAVRSFTPRSPARSTSASRKW